MFVKDLDINVVEAAERRILEAFNKNKVLAVSFSGGKDSICMCDILIKTMHKYSIPFSRIMVVFLMRKRFIRTWKLLQWNGVLVSCHWGLNFIGSACLYDIIIAAIGWRMTKVLSAGNRVKKMFGYGLCRNLLFAITRCFG